MEKHPENFDSFGVALLSDIPSGSLVVIDEIGKMENEAMKYADAVLSLLDCTDIQVLGVIQNGANAPWVNQIRAHKMVETMEVTKEGWDVEFVILKEKIQ